MNETMTAEQITILWRDDASEKGRKYAVAVVEYERGTVELPLPQYGNAAYELFLPVDGAVNPRLEAFMCTFCNMLRDRIADFGLPIPAGTTIRFAGTDVMRFITGINTTFEF